jgi:carboxyl-terminal processing protease
LQDYGRALVVGDKSTHGKGTVQTVYDLGKVSRRFPANYNPGALKTTIRKFYRANGSSTQLKGVTPDIVLPSIANHMEAGEGMHDYAMPWDTIPTAEFMNLGRIQPKVEELRRRSDARQTADKDFAYLREDIDHYKKAIEDKSLSLNYDERVKEREANEARLKARKEERSHRGENGEKAYEITLKLADRSGLPPAVGATNAAPASVEGENPVETAKKPADEAEDDELDKTPPVDVTLNEARRILLDLIELSKASAKAPAVAVSK